MTVFLIYITEDIVVYIILGIRGCSEKFTCVKDIGTDTPVTVS